MEKKSTSGFAGFLDGYTANNIESSSTVLKFHTGELSNLLNALIQDIQSNYSGQESVLNVGKLTEARDALNTTVKFDHYMSSSLAFEEFVIELKKIGESLKSTTQHTIKKIIYHYLNIAKQAGDGQLNDIVIRIATKFD